MFSQAQKGTCAPICLSADGRTRCTQPPYDPGYYFIERLGSRQTEPLYLDLFNHLESLYMQSA